MSGKSPIKRRQRPNMTISVDWGVQHQFKQTIQKNNTNPESMLYDTNNNNHQDHTLKTQAYYET